MALVAYQLQQLFLFPLAELEPIVWMLAGGLLATTWPPATERRSTATLRAAAALTGAASVAALVLGGLDVAADRLAQRAVDRGDVATAGRAVALRPDRLRLHLLEAALTTDAAARLAAVDDGLRWSPGDPIALARRAEYLAESDPSAAIGELRRLLADDPLNGSLQLLAGTAAANTGDLHTAEAAWLAALDLSPDDSRPALNLATLYRQQGRTAEAARMSQIAEAIGNP
jgi:Flp pilus assembly protein TadD